MNEARNVGELDFINSLLATLPTCKVIKTLPEDLNTIAAYVTPKLDGFSAIVYTYGKETKAITRTGQVITSKLRNCEDFKRLAIPEFAAVQCELYLPNGRSSDVSSAMAVASNELKLMGISILTMHSTFGLLKTRELIARYGVTPVPTVSVQNSLLVSAYAEASGVTKQGALQYIRHSLGTPVIRAFEGYVFRNTNLLHFYKYKDTLTADLLVTGVKPGNGKYTGLVGALTVSTSDGKEVANVSGMTDTQRQAFTDQHKQGLLVGTLVEVEYQEVGAGGKLRFPRFKRVRDDKATANSLEELG